MFGRKLSIRFITFFYEKNEQRRKIALRFIERSFLRPNNTSDTYKEVELISELIMKSMKYIFFQ